MHANAETPSYKAHLASTQTLTGTYRHTENHNEEAIGDPDLGQVSRT